MIDAGDLPDFIQIPPEVHAGRVLAQPDKVPAQEHLAPLDLRCILMQIVLFHLGLVDGGLGVEGTRGDVALKQLLVDQVDDGGDQLLQVFAALGECFDVGCEDGQRVIETRVLCWVLPELKSRK